MSVAFPFNISRGWLPGHRMGWLLSAALVLLFSGAPAQPSRPGPFEARSVTATVGPSFFIELAVERPGIIAEYLVDEGATVAEGQGLLQLKNEIEKAQLANAKTGLKEARAVLKFHEGRLARVKKMQAENVASEQELEQAEVELARARAQVEKSRAEVAIAEARLAQTLVEAPVAGVWLRSLKSPGEALQAFEPVGILTDPGELQATFLCPPAWEGLFEQGQRVTVFRQMREEAKQGEALRGTVRKVDPLVDPATMRFRVVVSLDAARVRSGQPVRLDRPEAQ